MRNRILTLLIALTLGVVAVTAVTLYIRGVEEESLQGLETKSILVTTRSLPAGMSGDEIVQTRAFETEKVPARYVLPGALTSPEALKGIVLADDIAAGEQITSQRFEATAQDAFLSEFPKGTEALTLPLQFVRGVGSHLNAGDRVNAYVTAEADDASSRFIRASRIPSSVRVFDAGESGVTLLLLNNLPVQEVHPAPSPRESASNSAIVGDLTLAVTPSEAALLVHSQEKGQLWFTLVPDDGKST